jgi:hypothetical protein
MLSLILIACHMIGDYIAQNDWMAANKLHCWKVRAIHVTCYSLCFAPVALYSHATTTTAAWFFAWLWITHFITDSRRWASGDKWPPKPILVDQSIHLATLTVLGVAFLEY